MKSPVNLVLWLPPEQLPLKKELVRRMGRLTEDTERHLLALSKTEQQARYLRLQCYPNP